MSDASIIADIGANTQPFEQGMRKVRTEAAGGKGAINELARPMEQVSKGMMLLRGGAAGLAIAGAFRAGVAAANEMEVGINANADAVRRLNQEMTSTKGSIGQLSMGLVGGLARIGERIGDEIASALSLAGVGDFDPEGAARSRQSQEQLDRFQKMRERARTREQQDAAAKAAEDKRQSDIKARQEKEVADARRKTLEEIAALEAKLNERKESDAVRLGKLNERIARLQYAEQHRVGDAFQQTRLQRLQLEVERKELIGEIEAKNEEHRKQLQDEYIRAEEAYLAAKERAEARITQEIKNRAQSLMPNTQATDSQQGRIERLRDDLARAAQQLQRAQALGLPTQDLQGRVRRRAARLAEAEGQVEEQTRRIAEVVTLGVRDALGEKMDAQIRAQENLSPLAGDMQKSRMALQNIEKALAVGVK
jgi:hypothetical protein